LTAARRRAEWSEGRLLGRSPETASARAHQARARRLNQTADASPTRAREQRPVLALATIYSWGRSTKTKIRTRARRAAADLVRARRALLPASIEANSGPSVARCSLRSSPDRSTLPADVGSF